MRPICLACFALLCLAFPFAAFSPADEPRTDPPLPDGAAKALAAIKGFRLPAGMKAELFAAEPQLASPVAICLDEQGRVYAAEEYRFNRGTEENRTRPFLLDDDLQIETLDDRLAMYRKFADRFEGGMEWFTRHTDQVRLLEDRDGDGRADVSTIFASDFNEPLSGLASGLIAREGNIYLTCIPDLWLLRDNDGDGRAEVRRSLHRGFGVNCAFLGHDLHGLAWGPDGRLYFSVGDRGFHVVTKEGQTLHGPRTGAVFRCEPDGANLEVIYRGLRNPQELAFDQYGNLFAADNNCDKGDHSRLVYIVEGGDSGWNMAYQTIPEPYLTGPWHAEKIWHLQHEEQPAWIVPPVGPLGAGPSGFAYYPGIGLNDRYREHFFLCNYTGGGGIESFALKPRGAGYEIVDPHDFLKPINATDAEFGYDGKLYVSDFVGLNWDGRTMGGRVFTVFDPQRIQEPSVREVTALFRQGFTERPTTELVKLLSHADQRVRLRAQYALAERADGQQALLAAMKETHELLPRLHTLWGLGQIVRKSGAASEEATDVSPALAAIVQSLNDEQPEVRAQAAKLVGDLRSSQGHARLLELLSDESPRVRMFAAEALGKTNCQAAIEPIFALLEQNADADPWLRHAGVYALASLGAQEAAVNRNAHASRSVRLAALLVLRRLRDERVSRFLTDQDLLIAAEAARAVNDLPLDKSTPELARLAEEIAVSPKASFPDALVRRVVHANFRLGQSEQAVRVARIASNAALSEPMRAEAIAALSDWTAPGPRDRVTGFWRPLPQRDAAIAREAIGAQAATLLASAPAALQAKVAELFAKHNVVTDEAMFAQWVGDQQRAVGARAAALRLLALRKAPQSNEALQTALRSDAPALRAAARDLLAEHDPARAVVELSAAIDSNDTTMLERQRAIAALPRLKSPQAGEHLLRQVESLAAGRLANELALDVAEAALACEIQALREKLQAALATTDEGASSPPKIALFRLALFGGDAARGRELFFNHRQAQCVRCHKVNGQGGDAGPDLSEAAKRNAASPREHLLQSLLDPNAKLAEGFATATLVLDDGRVMDGVIQKETAEELILKRPDGTLVKLSPAAVEARSAPKSAMPAMAETLTPREARDLIEFLMTAKEATAAAN